MKTLVCLLSEQHVPNLLSVWHERPARLVLVTTKLIRGKHIDEYFLKALEKMHMSFEESDHLTIVEVPDGKDNSFPDLKALFSQKILEGFPESEFVINLTGGTKLMCLALYDVFRSVPNATFRYIDVARPNHIQDVLTSSVQKIHHSLPLSAFLAGYGYDCELRDDSEKMQERFDLTRKIALSGRNRIWGSVGAPLQDWLEYLNKHRKKPQPLKEGYLHPEDNAVYEGIKEMFHLDVFPDQSLRGAVSHDAVFYLNGIWLEEFIWGLLNCNAKELGITEVYHSVVIRRYSARKSDGSDNEFDVVFMKKGTLHIVECKSGFQEKMQENLYKLFAVVKGLGGLRVKSHLVSNSPQMENDATGNRAKLFAIHTLSPQTILDLAAHPDDPALLRKAFDLND